MHLHPVVARNIAGALRQTKARCIQVSSYWAYYPQVQTQMNESHPRRGGPPWVRNRREAEDALFDAGAAILHLPDFYGPRVHVLDRHPILCGPFAAATSPATKSSLSAACCTTTATILQKVLHILPPIIVGDFLAWLDSA